jgi:hypothetical protein
MAAMIRRRHLVDPVRVVLRLRQEGRDGGQERGLGDAARAVRAEVAGDLAGAHREADQRRVAHIERFHQGVQVGGEGVVVVADRRLAGLAEAAAVVGNDPVTGAEQGRDLLFPGPPAEREAVDEDDGTARAVVLVVELDRRRILLTDRHPRHRWLPFTTVPNRARTATVCRRPRSLAFVILSWPSTTPSTRG